MEYQARYAVHATNAVRHTTGVVARTNSLTLACDAADEYYQAKAGLLVLTKVVDQWHPERPTVYTA
jgi:hypothetical protein